MHRTNAAVVLASLALVTATGVLIAGPLDPPAGPVGPTYKTLTEVEPRIAISAASTPGDATSVFMITQPGSYYLTGDVDVSTNRTAIYIAATDVTIDLNGFTLRGTPATQHGIRIIGEYNAPVIRNGSITGFGLSGIDLGVGSVRGARVENVRLVGNASYGIRSSQYCRIIGCHAQSNGAAGIFALPGSIVEGCTSSQNTGDGFVGSTGAVFRGCVAQYNGGSGVKLGLHGVAERCLTLGNAVGIEADFNCAVTHCTDSDSQGHGIIHPGQGTVAHCQITRARGDGILFGADGMVLSNHTDQCGYDTTDGAGIHITGADNRVEGNNCLDADRGIDVDSAGNFIARNTCSGNTTNWTVGASNACLVVNAALGAAINGSSGGVSPGGTDPNANFSY